MNTHYSQGRNGVWANRPCRTTPEKCRINNAGNSNANPNVEGNLNNSEPLQFVSPLATSIKENSLAQSFDNLQNKFVETGLKSVSLTADEFKLAHQRQFKNFFEASVRAKLDVNTFEVYNTPPEDHMLNEAFNHYSNKEAQSRELLHKAENEFAHYKNVPEMDLTDEQKRFLQTAHHKIAELRTHHEHAKNFLDFFKEQAELLRVSQVWITPATV